MEWRDLAADLLKLESESGSEAETEEDSDPQPEEVAYTPNLEIVHSSLEKEMDCSSGTQPRVRDREIGHIRWVSYDNGMLW